MTDRSRLILRSLVPSLLLVAMLVVWIGTRRDSERAGRNLHGWDILGGELSPLGEAAGGRVYSSGPEAARLAHSGTTLTLGPRTRLEFSPEAEDPGSTPPSLPRLRQGSYEVEMNGFLILDGVLLEGDGPTRFIVRGRRITILDGGLRFEERLYARGESFARPGGIRVPPGPGVGSDSLATPGLSELGREAARPTGRIVDVASGRGLADARLRGTFSHMDSGYPPLPVERSRFEIRGDAGGHFTVPDFRPDDPQLYLHLEVLRAGYLPRVHVIERERDHHDRWPFTTIALRPGRVETLIFMDEKDARLAQGAVQFEALDEESFVGEDSWEEGRSVRPGRLSVRYTDENGELPIEFTPVAFTLLHPEYYVWNRERKQLVEGYSLDPLRASKTPSALYSWNEIPVRAVDLFGARLVDERGEAVSHSLVEVTLESGGSRTLRLYTDAEGSFALAPLPPAGSLDPNPTFPIPARILTLSPLLWKHEASIEVEHRAAARQLPPRIAYLNGRGGSELRLRITDENEKPISHGPVELDDRLTLVRHDADGVLRFQGSLPTSRELIHLRVNGFLPLELRLPAVLPGEPEMDLGDVGLQRGETLKVQLLGGDAKLHERARLLISGEERHDVHHVFVHHVFAFDESGRVAATGLERGRRYTYAVEGSRLVTTGGEFEFHETVARDGLAIPVEPSGEMDVRVGGEVTGVREPGFRVVERFYMRDGSIRSFKSYPLSPDGVFGSRRFSAVPDSVEVFILGEELEGVRARCFDPSLKAVFDFGKLTLQSFHHAVFRFRTETGIVAFPPAGLSLFCDEGDYHEVAKIHRLDGGELLLRNLVPATYSLRWEVGAKRGGHVFEIGGRDRSHKETVVLPAELVDRTIVRMEDPDGQPIENATLTRVTPPSSTGEVPGGEPPGPDRGGPDRGRGVAGIPATPAGERPPGLYVVPIDPGTENRYHITADDRVPVELELGRGRPFPEPLVLPGGTRIRALVLSPDGLPFNGTLVVRSEAIEEEPERGPVRVITRADEEPPPKWTALPFEATLRQGNLVSDRVLVGLQELIFEDASSEAEVRVLSPIRAGDLNDLGTIRLDESRHVIGRVYLPHGEPATEAIVALVAPEHADRYPQGDDPIRYAAYSARTDALGRFRIRGLPLDLDREYALVAHADGWTDAIEDPFDLALEEHELRLSEETQLVLDIGYSRGVGELADEFEFRLWYEFPSTARLEEEVERLDLGRLAPTPRGGRLYRGITAGTYVLTWNLKVPFPDAGPRSSAAPVHRGRASTLRLRVDDEFLSGRALFNATPLESGWVVYTDDPTRSFLSRVGRVRNGTYVLPVPRRAENAYVALIPQRDPIPSFNPVRGEALPRAVEGFRAALRTGTLDIRYEAFDLTVELPPRLFDGNPRLSIEFPHYRLARTGDYVPLKEEEALAGSTIHFSLLPRGVFAFRVLSGRTSRLIQSIELYEDTELELR